MTDMMMDAAWHRIMRTIDALDAVSEETHAEDSEPGGFGGPRGFTATVNRLCGTGRIDKAQALHLVEMVLFLANIGLVELPESKCMQRMQAMIGRGTPN